MSRQLPLAKKNLDLPAVETMILDRWKREKTFERSVASRSSEQEFAFYDGPPFANGLPHYGHLLTGYVKDVVPRWRTMNGDRVERRFGWDCHGLPAEMEAEKSLKVFGRAAVLAYGVDKFNDYCRESVLRYADIWESSVTRQARWVDLENAYKTMDLPYMESVIWAFAELHKRGLIYEGHRVLPYCWECETPLSNFETRLDDAYRERKDLSATVALTVTDAGRLAGLTGVPDGGNYRLLVWTTTPWTLPSNLAVAVNPELPYVVVSNDGHLDILAADRLAAYSAEVGADAGGEVVATVTGADLVGLGYRPPFRYFADTAGAFRVLSADFVEAESGTGLVHMAPAFGEDDQKVCEAAGIPMVNPVDDRGQFTSQVPDYQGQLVFDANATIVRDLKAGGTDAALIRAEQFTHSYPHCWRTDTPLIYRAQSSWFVSVAAHRERLLELNEEINWVPGHIKHGSFGNWLAGARDWSVSRNRFWGSPIPVWKSDDPAYPRVDVYGSIAELERDFGSTVTDLHRPSIDDLTRPNPDDPSGRSTMRRVPEVLDVWFDSGSMPYAQTHYPFENREWFDAHSPADFIVEYNGQTRGWFYTLHVLSTLLFDRPAFSNAVVHGILLGADGRKMSKRLGNYPEPALMFEKYGADAIRWFLMSSPVLTGREVLVSEENIAEVGRRVINPLWNAWYFLTLYADADEVSPEWRTDQTASLDRYLLAKTSQLVEEFSAAMDSFEFIESARLVEDHLEMLNNWWIRRSRERFWRRGTPGTAEQADKKDAYDTLYTVLEVLLRLMAPMLPMLVEHIWCDLTGEDSVHLQNVPQADDLPRDGALVSLMDRARAVITVAHAIRLANGLRVRQPLAGLTVAGVGAGDLGAVEALLADELNVKQVSLIDAAPTLGSQTLEVSPRKVGPRLGGAVQQVLAAARAGEWEQGADGAVTLAGHTLEAGEFEIKVRPLDETVSRVLLDGSAMVTLDTTLTPELVSEGLFRDVLRLVQLARREAGFDISDRIKLAVHAPDDVAAAIEAFRDQLAEAVLATSVTVTGDLSDAQRALLSDGRAIHFTVARDSADVWDVPIPEREPFES